jgi:hypothetical protein
MTPLAQFKMFLIFIGLVVTDPNPIKQRNPFQEVAFYMFFVVFYAY